MQPVDFWIDPRALLITLGYVPRVATFVQPLQETTQYLIWDKEGEEDSVDTITSQLFEAADSSSGPSGLGKKKTKNKKAKGKKSKKKAKSSKRKGKKSKKKGKKSSSSSSESSSDSSSGSSSDSNESDDSSEAG